MILTVGTCENRGLRERDRQVSGSSCCAKFLGVKYSNREGGFVEWERGEKGEGEQEIVGKTGERNMKILPERCWVCLLPYIFPLTKSGKKTNTLMMINHYVKVTA